MTRIRNIVLGLLLLSGLLYLGLKGYIYYQVKSSLDQAIATAAPIAEIQYDGIDSTLTGSVTVRDIRVRGFGDHLQLSALRFGTPNLVHLLGTLSELQRGEPPQFLELELSGLRLDLNGPLMGLLQGAVESKVPRLPASYPCAGQIAFGPAAWRAMGYERLLTDVYLRVDLDKDAHAVRLHGKWKTADMGEMDFRTELARIDPVIDRLPDVQHALLRSFELDYTDHSYYQRWVRYCAGRDKTDASAFIAAVVNADATYYMYSWGVVPGSDLRRAYGEFLRNPRSFSVVARPGTPVDMALLARYAPDDLVALLDLRLLVNGRGVESSQVSYRPELLGRYAATPAQPAPQPMPKSPPQRAVQPAPKAAPQSNTASNKAAAPRAQSRSSSVAKPPQASEYGYRQVRRDQLGRYVGRYVRVYTAEGTAREGVLNAVRDSEVLVERRMYGGSMAVPVPLSKIERVEVWLPQNS